jgi:hypothetical protein
VDRILLGLEAELFGRAVDDPTLDAAAGQPHIINCRKSASAMAR